LSDQTITLLVLAVVVVVFIADFLPVAVVAVGAGLLLWATAVLDLQSALAGFGDPAVLFIASLFIVSESLDATGVTAWAVIDSRITGNSACRSLSSTAWSRSGSCRCSGGSEL
jgi:hypothetical protein